jgi:hypothetical protein
MLFFPLFYYISCSTPLQDTAVDILKRPDDWEEQKQEDNVVEETEQELDRDGDGQDAIEDGGNDCDDWDPNSYMGAYEIEDGKDNDCDGYKDWDGVFDDGSILIHSQAIFEGNFYEYDDACSGTVFRQNGQIEVSFSCNIIERPLSNSLLGAEIRIESQGSFAQGGSWSGDALFSSFGGEFEWDSSGDISLQWSSMNNDGARSVDVTIVLDAIYLDIVGGGTVEK